MKKQKVVCIKCKTEFEDKPKQSFLGFQVFTCPKCAEKITYPLTGGYRLIYWFVLIGLILYSVSAISQGSIPIPGLLGIAAIIGLVRDRSLRNKLKRSEGSPANAEVATSEPKKIKDLTGEQYQRIQSYKNRPVKENTETTTIKLSPREKYDSQDSLMEATVFYNKADLRLKPSNYPENEQDTYGLLELVDTGRVAISSKSDGILVDEIKKEIYRDSFEEKYLYYFPNGELFYEVKTMCVTPRMRH